MGRASREKANRSLTRENRDDVAVTESQTAPMARQLVAEFIGTFWLVLAGCGTAVISAAHPQIGIGAAGVATAFGLSVLTVMYAVGHISAAHFNPAVTFGCLIARRIGGTAAFGYFVAQVIGAIVAAELLTLIASGGPAFNVATNGLAANGYAEHSPAGYSLVAASLAEVITAMMFVVVFLGATSSRVPDGFAPIAIGLSLTLIHLVTIPITNTSVNPARSTGPALVVGGWALKQLWLFWAAPLLGAACGALVHRGLEPAKSR